MRRRSRACSSPPRRWWRSGRRRKPRRCRVAMTTAAWVSNNKNASAGTLEGRGSPRPFSSSLTSERHESCPGPALDGGTDQPLDRQSVAQELEKPQLVLRRLAIARHHIAGERVGGL